jgi:hypothetical protein
MKNKLKHALIANAATLGVHWIYNYNFLDELSKNQSLLFLDPDENLYKEAKISYFAYPGYKAGDFTGVGQLILKLYDALSQNPSFSIENYKTLLTQLYEPGGTYKGYVESYGKKLIFNQLKSALKIDMDDLMIDDHQLVGFAPYVTTKALGFETAKAIELASALSTSEDYQSYFTMLDHIQNVSGTLHEKIKKSIHLAPTQDHEALKQAIMMDDTDKFIEAFAGRGCDVSHTLPVIIHVLVKTNAFEEAVHFNAKIGGDSADRALLIGLLYHDSDIPESWKKYLNI